MRFNTLYILTIFAALFCSCGEKGPDQGTAPEIKIQIAPQSISVSSDAQDVTLSVGADSDWGVTPLDSWVKTSPTGGIKGETTVKVSIEENKTDDERQTTLLFRVGTQKVEIPVQQPSPRHVLQ